MTPNSNNNEKTIANYQFGEGTAQPSPEYKPFLIIIAGPNVGEMHCLDKDEVTIGRAETCDIILADPSISRKHAKVMSKSDTVTLVDLESTNGTFVEDVRITSQLLKDGDKIRVGQTAILKFSYQDTLDEQFQRKLFDSATRDPLTHIYNRRYIMDRLISEISHSRRQNSHMTLLMFDLDRFKKINDTFGHTAGDHVLRELTKKIASTLREEDVFARYGGEEFIILMRDTAPNEASLAGERLRKLVESLRFVYEGVELCLTISVGLVCYYNNNFQSAEEIINAVDSALYTAKNHGRNRVECA